MAKSTNVKKSHKGEYVAQTARTFRNKTRQAKARDRKATSRLGLALYARLRKRLQKKAEKGEIQTANANALKEQLALRS